MIQSLAGLLGLIFIAWLFSESRKDLSMKNILSGLILQFGVAVLMLKVPFFSDLVMYLNHAVDALQQATQAGTSFVFGYLGGAPLPFTENSPGASWTLAFRALPLILVVSALSALLFYWRVIPVVVKFFSLALQKTMDIGGALGLGVASNIFVGMVEAPIIIGPYVKSMSRSELMTLMISGMATISGTVLVLYASILNPVLPGAIGHILTASIISAPAAILISRVMVPEHKKPSGRGRPEYKKQCLQFHGRNGQRDIGWSYSSHQRCSHAAGTGRPCSPDKSGSGIPAGYFRRTADPTTHSRLHHVARSMADGNSSQ